MSVNSMTARYTYDTITTACIKSWSVGTLVGFVVLTCWLSALKLPLSGEFLLHVFAAAAFAAFVITLLSAIFSVPIFLFVVTPFTFIVARFFGNWPRTNMIIGLTTGTLAGFYIDYLISSFPFAFAAVPIAGAYGATTGLYATRTIYA